MNVVICGTTGLTGSVLLQKLLQDDKVNSVISVSRRTCGVTSSKLREVLIEDFSSLVNLKDSLKGDVYYCCLGTTIAKAGTKEKFRKLDYDAVMDFARVAEFHQAYALAVVLAMGADPDSLIFYNRVKGEVERDLQKLKLKNLVLLKPSLLVGDRKENRMAEKIATVVLLSVGVFLSERMNRKLATSVESLAECMHQLLNKKPEGLKIVPADEII